MIDFVRFLAPQPTIDDIHEDKSENVSAMCKELSQGLTMLSELNDRGVSNTSNKRTSPAPRLNGWNSFFILVIFQICLIEINYSCF